MICVDGVSTGTARDTRRELAVGAHEIEARLTDYETVRRDVDVSHGTTQPFAATLRYQFGRVRVETTPERASVTSSPSGIHGVTPLALDRVQPQRYRVSVRMADRAPYEETIDVRAGETSTIDARLGIHPEILRARRAKMLAGAKWTSYAVSAAAVVAGYIYQRSASDHYNDADTAHEQYVNAQTTVDAESWRQAVSDADARGDRAKGRRNVFFGIAGVGLGAGVALTIQ